MKTTVELMTEDDVRWTVDVAIYKMIYEEMKQPLLYNEGRAELLARECMQKGVALVGKVDNVPVGVLSGICCEHPLNPELTVLTELIWYILPSYRKSRIGILLLRRYLELAEKCADIGTFSLLPSSDIRSLERFGFRMAERAYQIEFGGNKWQ